VIELLPGQAGTDRIQPYILDVWHLSIHIVILIMRIRIRS